MIKRTNQMIFMYNGEHYMKVVKERSRLGKSEADSKLRNQIIDYPLVGTQITNSKGKTYIVEQANKQWYNGYYIGILIQCNGSHAFIDIENINCEDEIVLQHIAKNKKEFNL